MVVGELAEPVDLLVVGGGPGGYVAALRAVQEGRAVTLVDRLGDDGVGGVCLREGCIPSKALIEVATRAAGAAAMRDAGLGLSDVSFDMRDFQRWKDGIVARLGGGVAALLAKAGVRVLAGDLRFTRPNQAVVRTLRDQASFIEFADAVIATGSRPAGLSELPRDGRRVLDSTDVLALPELPGSLLVVGGGYIGLEIGTACAHLGCNVTIVEQADELLPSMDPRLVRPVRRRLDGIGVDVHVGAKVHDLDASAASVHGPRGEHRVVAERVVVAVGRLPNTDELGLEQAGIRPRADGRIEVRPDRRVTDHVAAVGDITPGHALAHKASAEARVAVEALCGRRVAFAPAAVPAVVFADPEIASAGLTLDQARVQGIDATSASFPLAASGRAATLDVDDGYGELVVDLATDAIVGVHLVGPHASDLIAEGVLAIEMGATTEDVALSIHPHPTLSEQFAEAAHLATGHPVHVGGAGSGQRKRT